MMTGYMPIGLPFVNTVPAAAEVAMDATTQIIEALIAGGMAPAEAAAMMARAASEISVKPSTGSERTKRWRERHKASQSVTVTSRDAQESFFSPNKDSISEERKKDSACDEKRHSDWPSDYAEQFWQQCPRKVAKAAAMRSLEKVKKSGIPWATLWAGLLRWSVEAMKTEQKYVKHPSTWLLAGCWDDEPMKNGGYREDDRSISAAAKRLAEGGGFTFGPRPREPLYEPGEDNVRLLAQERHLRSGNLLDGGSSSPLRISSPHRGSGN